MTFAPFSEMYRVLHVANYTTDEFKATWYSRYELKQVVSQALEEAHKMACHTSALSQQDAEECRQGLEGFTPEGTRLKEQRRWEAMDAVLDEQASQQESKTFDPERIAKKYFEITHHCQIVANGRGLQYEQDIANWLEDKTNTVKETTTKGRQGSRRDLSSSSSSSPIFLSPNKKQQSLPPSLRQHLQGGLRLRKVNSTAA